MKPLLSAKNIIGTDEWKAEKAKEFNKKRLGELLEWQISKRAIIVPIVKYTDTGIFPDYVVMEMSEEEYKRLKENYDKENKAVAV